MAIVVAGSTVIATVALGATQTPFVITHSKTLTPTPKLFKVVVADVGEVAAANRIDHRVVAEDRDVGRDIGIRDGGQIDQDAVARVI